MVKKSLWLFIGLALCFTSSVYAVGDKDTIPLVKVDDEIVLFDPLDTLTDGMFAACYKYNKPKPSKYGWDTAYVPVHSDAEIMKNMSRIPTVMPLVYNQYVKGFINMYSSRKREQMRRMLGLTEMYFPIFEQALDRKKMPIELKYLAIVESALNPNAVSKAGATGLWQIMYSTGKWLNMDIHTYIDERRDPYKSTEAALDYLQRLHDIYSDWFLAIAAYNCGPGNVNKAIKRSGGKTNFWEIKPYLPKETQGYVPAFIAAMYVMHYFEEYNYQPDPCGFSFNAVDTVVITEQVSLQQIADMVKMDYAELQYLNPALTKKIIPASYAGYALKLPMNKVGLFEDLRDSIFMAGPSALDIVTNNSTESDKTPSVTYAYTDTKTYHTVKSGESLGRIADKYNVTVTEIKKWNGLVSSTIRTGQKLKIIVKAKTPVVKPTIAPPVKEEEDEKVTVENGTAPKNNTVSPVSTDNSKPSSEITVISYTVKTGDNLNSVCAWFDADMANLLSWNNMASSKLTPGQKLNIYVPSNQVEYYRSIDKLTAQEKIALSKVKGKNTPVVEENDEPVTAKPKVVYYLVKPGDTLWDISKRYPGVTVDDIKRSNGLDSGKSLKAGMKLKIEL